MSIANTDAERGMEPMDAGETVSSPDFVGAGGSNETGSALLSPSCLGDEALRRVRELDSPTSRFYINGVGLCLVEAVELSDGGKFSLDEILERVERKLIEFTLGKTGGARSGAARLMGISRSRLYRRLYALGLDAGADGDDEEDGQSPGSDSHAPWGEG